MPPAILTRQSLLMIRPWRCVWLMPCLSATEKLFQTLLVAIFWPGPSVLMPLIKTCSARPQKIALKAIRDGKPVAELENNGVTNGAAMRVSPLGCLLPARDLDAFIDDVALASSPTHKSDFGYRWRSGGRVGGITRYRRRRMVRDCRRAASHCPTCATKKDHYL
ncbi:ADP-ribosylglycohydrolase [Citrobacter freundii]|nr:ADP-ribosylglycohydrolase [Citrobacter freundii]